MLGVFDYGITFGAAFFSGFGSGLGGKTVGGCTSLGLLYDLVSSSYMTSCRIWSEGAQLFGASFSPHLSPSGELLSCGGMSGGDIYTCLLTILRCCLTLSRTLGFVLYILLIHNFFVYFLISVRTLGVHSFSGIYLMMLWSMPSGIVILSTSENRPVWCVNTMSLIVGEADVGFWSCQIPCTQKAVSCLL